MRVWHALRRWERTAALVCVGALLVVVASCTGTLLRPCAELAVGRLARWRARSPGGASSDGDWRLLFCPPLRTPWSFDYLELTWLRAAVLVNATGGAAASEGQQAAIRRYASWSPGSMPWRDAGAIYVRLYKSGNDAFKGETSSHLQQLQWKQCVARFLPGS